MRILQLVLLVAFPRKGGPDRPTDRYIGIPQCAGGGKGALLLVTHFLLPPLSVSCSIIHARVLLLFRPRLPRWHCRAPRKDSPMASPRFFQECDLQRDSGFFPFGNTCHMERQRWGESDSPSGRKECLSYIGTVMGKGDGGGIEVFPGFACQGEKGWS